MEHFARWVVRHRKAVLAAAVLLLIPSVFGAAGTYINYDILTYLRRSWIPWWAKDIWRTISTWPPPP